jgi:vancomycin resistance protein VanJ
VVSLVRFGPGVVSLPREALDPEAALRVLAWNIEDGRPGGSTVIDTILDADVDLVVLQELTPRIVTALDADPRIGARFPHRSAHPHPSVRGMGVWSRFPLTERVAAVDPALQEVVIDAPAGSMTVVNAHPVLGRFRGDPRSEGGRWFDPAMRDAALREVRVRIDAALAAGERLLVAADLNLTDREPAWAWFSDGLVDLHVEVGQGSGSTWRPTDWRHLPFVLLRIDYLLAGPGVRAVAAGTDCTPRGSDHCVVRGVVELE